MIKVGLTGGIASGKSAVSEILKELGAYILDADRIAREAAEPGTSGLAAIVRQFGPEVLNGDGSLNRKALGKIVFADAKKRKMLEEILHPQVLAELLNRTREIGRENPKAVVVYDVPLLIESGMQGIADTVWLVSAPEETRIERIMRRDGVDRGEALQRIRSQMPQEEKTAYADVIIDNSKSREALYRTVRENFEALEKK